jgi:selenocysteine-specific elongation factor
VIGTAGHIDHGKTTLVKVLTGIDTDRLKEEKERGITIELGFAPIRLPGGINTSIVDVPGHEKFIKNMLAGAAGIDIALLVIAADEGIMPQTQEHFDILRLLLIKKILVVITKVDLVDNEMVELVKEEIQEFLLDTPYEDSPVLTFSAIKEDGKEAILKEIDKAVIETASEKKTGILARLPIDRVFTIPGFGTVVTGTLFNGEITVGKQMYIPVKDKHVRVRNLQVHNRSVDKVQAGQRVAINLAGVDHGEVVRGDVLTEENNAIITQRIDVSFYLLKNIPDPLSDFSRVRFHHGTSEIMGRIKLLDREKLQPGEEAYIQIILENPAVIIKGDRFILRSYSPLYTIGGGEVIEPYAEKHKSRDSDRIIRDLNIKAKGTAEDILNMYLEQSKRPLSVETISKESGINDNKIISVIDEMVKSGQVFSILLNDRDKGYMKASLLKEWENKVIVEVEKRLQDKPLEPGVNKDSIHSQLFSWLSLKEFNALVKYWTSKNVIKITDGLYIAPFHYNWQPQGLMLEKIKEIEELYLSYNWQIPGWNEIAEQLKIDRNTGNQLLQFMLRTEKIIHLDDDIYITSTLLINGKEKIRKWFVDNKDMTVAQARDLLGTTRKIAIPLLEYLDRIKFTVRYGDKRKKF